MFHRISCLVFSSWRFCGWNKIVLYSNQGMNKSLNVKWYAPVLTFAKPEGQWDDPEGVLDVHRLLGILALQDLVSHLRQFSILVILWPTGNKLTVKFNMKYNYFSSDMVEDFRWLFHLMGMPCPNKINHTELGHWHDTDLNIPVPLTHFQLSTSTIIITEAGILWSPLVLHYTCRPHPSPYQRWRRWQLTCDDRLNKKYVYLMICLSPNPCTIVSESEDMSNFINCPLEVSFLSF